MTEAAAATEESAQPEPRRYDLFLRHRGGIFYIRLKDHGITPGLDRLWYMQDGRWGYRPYSEIMRVNLSSGHVHRHGQIGQCTITFRNGAVLVIFTTTDRGLPDLERQEAYFGFITDLHRRLLSSGAARHIQFTRGVSPGRQAALYIMLVVAGLTFVALPVILAVVARSWEILQTLLFGVALVWPVWKMTQRNEPGPYDPRDPPDMLD